jgi:predicted NBD/HSP70 family sugar kinase
MYYIGLDVHKQKISYCVKDSSGKIYAEGSIPAARSRVQMTYAGTRKSWFECARILQRQGLEENCR